MKTLRTLFAALAIMMMSIAASAQPMSVYSMRNNARFLTDRMAHTLRLSAAILDDLYYINYDYICGVNEFLDAVALGYRYDDYMEVVYARDYALRRLLTARQWELLMTYDYFYRPISFVDHRWSFSIYLHDRRMDRFYYRQPRLFDDYRGGRFFTGMRRIDGPMGGPGMPPGGPGMPYGAPGAPVAHPNEPVSGPGFHIGEVNNNVTAGRGDARTEAIRQSGTMNSTIRTSAANTNTGTAPTGGFTIGTPAGNSNQNMGGTRTNTTGSVGTVNNTRTAATAGRVGNESSTRTITAPTTTTNRSASTTTYNPNRTSAGSTYTPTRTTATPSSTTTRTSAATSTATRSAGASSSTATRSAGASSSTATRSVGTSSSTATRSVGTSSSSATRSAGTSSSSATRSVGTTSTGATRSAGRR